MFADRSVADADPYLAMLSVSVHSSVTRTSEAVGLFSRLFPIPLLSSFVYTLRKGTVSQIRSAWKWYDRIA